ncbi:11921_t:CDS:1, partial [Racocetra fulgida]
IEKAESTKILLNKEHRPLLKQYKFHLDKNQKTCTPLLQLLYPNKQIQFKNNYPFDY